MAPRPTPHEDGPGPDSSAGGRPDPPDAGPPPPPPSPPSGAAPTRADRVIADPVDNPGWSSTWDAARHDPGPDDVAPTGEPPPPAPRPVSARTEPPGYGNRANGPEPGTLPPEGAPGGRRNLLITVALVVVAGLVGAWLLLRPAPVELAVDGVPIANGDVVLADAERALATIVDADGSSTAEGTACFFGPGDAAQAGPRVVCGPVLLGISPPTQPWLLGGVSWGFPDDTVTGQFTGFDGTTTGDPGELERPDGATPVDVALAVPTSGLRTVEGARIVNAAEALAGTEQALATAVAQAGAATDDTTGCWFDTLVDGRGRTTTDGTAWCGPVLTLDSDPNAPWTTASTSTTSGDLLSTAVASAPSSVSLATTARDPGATLWRPDGRDAPTTIDLELPDAPPVEPGFATVLARPPDVTTTAPADGLLRTPDLDWTITGLATTDRVGSGPEAIVAPDDHELLVVESEVVVPDDRFGDPGVATLVVDGRRVPLEAWRDLEPDAATLVVAVPSDASEVVLEVLSQERSQGISLLTGDKEPGFPAGIYRSTEPVGVGRALTATVELPTGDPGRASATVEAVQLLGYDDDLGWAPDGQVFVAVAYAALDDETPCCDLDDLDVTAVPTLAVDGQASQPLDEPATSTTWAVPVDTTRVRLGLRADATWTGGSGATTATGRAEPVDVVLPP